MSKTVLLESHYFPCVEYFAQVFNSEQVILDNTEKYQKQSYRNRCLILGANKVETLSVPVLKPSGSNLTKDIKIDYTQKWTNNHIRAIQSAYGKAPYFPYFSEDFNDILKKNHRYLYDLNLEILQYIFKIFKVDTEIVEKSFLAEKNIFPDVLTLSNSVNRKKTVEKDAFLAYYQLFGVTFEPNLSILDILYNEGINAFSLIKETKL